MTTLRICRVIVGHCINVWLMCVYCDVEEQIQYVDDSRFLFQAEDGIRDLVRSRGLGDVYKRQVNLGFTEGYSKEILLLSSKPHSAYLVMKFENINTPQAATELIEQALFIDRKYVVYSNPFITPDLINYKIKDNNNLVIGELKEIYSSSAHPVWLIVNDDKQELMIPAVKEFITELNCSDKYATVKLIEGMAFE